MLLSEPVTCLSGHYCSPTLITTDLIPETLSQIKKKKSVRVAFVIVSVHISKTLRQFVLSVLGQWLCRVCCSGLAMCSIN
jgi:hypothetical protein